MKGPMLFDNPPKPRAKPRKLMHVIDAGPFDDEEDMCQFACKCGYESEWQPCKRSIAKRGIPCPKCNASQEEPK